jgi:hypothetical protein
LEWSRPETKGQAGKLLVIGGNSQGFAAPAEAYGLAEKAGAGTVRAMLPESLRRSVGKLFPEADFAPSTPSGSFALQALAELCDAAQWADGDLFCQQPLAVLHRPNTLLVVAMGQLQRLGSNARFPRAFTSELGLVQLIDNLHEFTKRTELALITKHQGHYVVAYAGQVSTTKIVHEKPIWRLKTAAAACVWWMQNPSKTLEALTTAVYLQK